MDDDPNDGSDIMAENTGVHNKGKESDGGAGKNGPSDIPEESVSSESELSMEQHLADKQAKEQGNK